ncbi:hypothetical protein [Burkholderia sp. 22313]|uniref:hypothetical protein n=1 Tax=Burkholderia sp. 22313 TaxID=3453908 RepID=UPI003F84577A
MELGIEDLRQQIPPYLTKPQQEGLIKALSQFPNKIDYYLDRYQTDLLQGDGWSSMDLIRFEDGTRKAVRGIVLSNSCDIDDGNERAVPPRLLFAPLVKLSRYVELLQRAGLQKEAIDGKLQAIREQAITSIFYLPAGARLEEDHIALLDDVHTLPVEYFLGKGEQRQKLFTLGMTGFYLFLFKLSVHLCRFHENVERYESA